MHRRTVIATALLLGLAARPAEAFELWGTGPLSGSTVQITTNFDLRYHHVPDKLEGFEDRNVLDYWEEVFRNNLLLTKEGLVIGAQLDQAAYFSNRYRLDGVIVDERFLYDENWQSPFDHALVRMEKLYLVKQWDNVELGLGDNYASYGRGFALNAIKNTAIDIDTSIRGATFTANAGDFEVSGISGLTNTQDVSMFNPNVAITEDPAHMITGMRMSHSAVGPAQLGVHGVVYRFARAEDVDLPSLSRYADDIDLRVVGASAEIMGLGGIDWYFEGDLFDYRGEEMIGDESLSQLTGFGFYTSATAYPGNTTIQFEAKRTKDTERINTFLGAENWEAAAAPTLEYELVITEDASATVNSNDLSGALVRIDYNGMDGNLIPYVSGVVFHDADTGGEHFNSVPENIGHGITGLQWFKGRQSLQLNTGYRIDQRVDIDYGADQMAHLDATWIFPVNPRDTFEVSLNGRKFQWGVNPLQQDDFLEMNNALAYHLGSEWVFILYQDFTNNPIIQSEGNLKFIDPASYGQEYDALYGAAEVIFHPKPASTLRLFYGAYKAGIRCAGGQCRSLPGFEGGRVTWQTTF
jgi:hypothetical protein